MQQLQLKKDFPVFEDYPELVYLDSAATSQKPRRVIEAIQQFYTRENANIHRGLYPLAARATARYEAVREKVAHFIGAASSAEIVYTSGTTDGINLVAQGFLAPRLQPGDEILLTMMEHHANLIPWQQLAIRKGARLRIVPVDATGTLSMTAFQEFLSPRTVMVACTHISNTLGTINPVEELVALVRTYRPEIPVLIDAAQSAAHYELQVQQIDCDFLVFSGHKLFGPTGIGVLYGKAAQLEQMQPVRFGGDMIESVSFEQATFAGVPTRFEAGTTHIAGVIGLGAAIDYLNELDRSQIRASLSTLRQEASERLAAIEGLRLVGTAAAKSAIVSFVLDQAHPHDIASFLGAANIAIRAGHHCTQPLMDSWELPGTVRASFALYNTREDVDRLVKAVQEISVFFA